jgi:hypothetical protein
VFVSTPQGEGRKVRHCERSEAIQGPQGRTGLLRRFAPRNDGQAHLRLLAAHRARVDGRKSLSLKQRGRRECRVSDAPVVPCKKHGVVATGSPGSTGIPCTMVYGLFRALPGETRACLSPSSPRSVSFFGNLTPAIGASGPHDLAVRVSRARQSQPSRPPLPAPNVRDDSRNAPLMGHGMAANKQVICPRREQKYFCKEGWTGFRARR